MFQLKKYLTSSKKQPNFWEIINKKEKDSFETGAG
jgi:hypothetical protein